LEFDLSQEKLSYYIENLSEQKVLISENIHEYYHPASLIKLFISLMIKEKFCFLENSETERAIRNTLKHSDNDALSYLFDLLTDTQSGPELEEQDLKEFLEKRKEISKFFLEKNYSEFIVLQNKCFDFDYYGRDRQIKNLSYNQVTVSDTVKIMKEIFYNHKDLLDFMSRNIEEQDDYQAQKFSLSALVRCHRNPEKFYSKAGWNSQFRHEASIFLLGGEYFLFVVLSKNYPSLPLFNKYLHLLTCSRLTVC
jgi:hypothetical protein